MEVHTLPKGSGPKENVIVWLEFDPAYYYITVAHVKGIPAHSVFIS